MLANGVFISRYLALVKHDTTEEHAFVPLSLVQYPLTHQSHLFSLFVFGRVNTSMLVEAIIPIYEDLKLSTRGDVSFEIQYPARQQIFVFETPSGDCMKNIVKHLQAAVTSARK